MLGALLGDAWAFFLLLGPSPVGCITVPRFAAARTSSRTSSGPPPKNAWCRPAPDARHRARAGCRHRLYLAGAPVGRLQGQNIGHASFASASPAPGCKYNDPFVPIPTSQPSQTDSQLIQIVAYCRCHLGYLSQAQVSQKAGHRAFVDRCYIDGSRPLRDCQYSPWISPLRIRSQLVDGTAKRLRDSLAARKRIVPSSN